LRCPTTKTLQTKRRQVYSDLHATVLLLMCIDHIRLTYKFQGREFRLTHVERVVMKKLVSKIDPNESSFGD
jgi:uncharacterized protein DUF1501